MTQPTIPLSVRTAICLLAVPLLAACQDDPEPTIVGEDSRGASGEILGGSISDDMLPIDSLQSTSPAAKETAGASDGKSSASNAPAASPAPAEPAAPEPSPTESSDVEQQAGPAAEPETE